MPAPFPWILQALLAVTFGWAALAKLVRWSTWRASLGPYGVPKALVSAVATTVPLAEATVAFLLVVGPSRVALAATLALVSAFSLAVLKARNVTGDRLPCGCFGRTEARDFRLMLGRNALLAATAGALLLTGAKGDLASTEAPSPAEVLPALLVAAGLGLVVWMLKYATTLMHRGEQS